MPLVLFESVIIFEPQRKYFLDKKLLVVLLFTHKHLYWTQNHIHMNTAQWMITLIQSRLLHIHVGFGGSLY